MRENQAGLRPFQGCIDQLFSLRQVSEKRRHIFRKLTIFVFLDLKAAFGSADRAVFGATFH